METEAFQKGKVQSSRENGHNSFIKQCLKSYFHLKYVHMKETNASY